MDTKKTAVYVKRKKTLKKKALELSTLCDIPVCVLCAAPNTGRIDTWPEDPEAVNQILLQFKGTNDPNLSGILETKDEARAEKSLVENARDRDPVVRTKAFETWDTRFDYMTEETLMCIFNTLHAKLEIVNKRIEIMHEEDDDDDEEGSSSRNSDSTFPSD